MEQLFNELIVESAKIYDPNYIGLVVVHPDDVDSVVEFMRNVSSDMVIEQKKYGATLKVKEGGEMHVRTATSDNWHFNHAGMQYTTIIISAGHKGKCVFDVDDSFKEFVNVCNVKLSESIPYMISRLRSQSKHPERLVYC